MSNSAISTDKSIWRAFIKSFMETIDLPIRLVGPDTLVWVDLTQRLQRLVLFRYSQPETMVHRAAINLHLTYPLMSWQTIVIGGHRYALQTGYSRNSPREMVLLPADKWTGEFSFHADEAEIAGNWLAQLVRFRCGLIEKAPEPPMPMEIPGENFDPIANLLGPHGYVWTRKAAEAMARQQAAEAAKAQRRRLWREQIMKALQCQA